ncbi:MAG: zinc ribbon domain-containing protein [Candidatus Micrarchaeota archaeon]
MKTCMGCKYKNSDDLKYCTNCGSKLRTTSDPVQKTGCVKCGTMIPYELKFCTECGEKMYHPSSISLPKFSIPISFGRKPAQAGEPAKAMPAQAAQPVKFSFKSAEQGTEQTGSEENAFWSGKTKLAVCAVIIIAVAAAALMLMTTDLGKTLLSLGTAGNGSSDNSGLALEVGLTSDAPVYLKNCEVTYSNFTLGAGKNITTYDQLIAVERIEALGSKSNVTFKINDDKIVLEPNGIRTLEGEAAKITLNRIDFSTFEAVGSIEIRKCTAELWTNESVEEKPISDFGGAALTISECNMTHARVANTGTVLLEDDAAVYKESGKLAGKIMFSEVSVNQSSDAWVPINHGYYDLLSVGDYALIEDSLPVAEFRCE